MSSEAESTSALIERMRAFEADHVPDGWPCIRMREITRLRAELAKVTWQRNEAQAGLAASQAESERLSSMIDHQRDEAMEMERMLRAELADSRAECERLRELDGRWVALVAADDDCHS